MCLQKCLPSAELDLRSLYNTFGIEANVGRIFSMTAPKVMQASPIFGCRGSSFKFRNVAAHWKQNESNIKCGVTWPFEQQLEFLDRTMPSQFVYFFHPRNAKCSNIGTFMALHHSFSNLIYRQKIFRADTYASEIHHAAEHHFSFLAVAPAAESSLQHFSTPVPLQSNFV